MRTLMGLALAGAMCAHATVLALAPAVAGSIILTEGGCGPGGYRDNYGYCRAYGGPYGYAPRDYYEEGYGVRWTCPPGWHFGRGRCWPDY
jgi:hypothetical protein